MHKRECKEQKRLDNQQPSPDEGKVHRLLFATTLERSLSKREASKSYENIIRYDEDIVGSYAKA